MEPRRRRAGRDTAPARRRPEPRFAGARLWSCAGPGPRTEVPDPAARA